MKVNAGDPVQVPVHVLANVQVHVNAHVYVSVEKAFSHPQSFELFAEDGINPQDSLR